MSRVHPFLRGALEGIAIGLVGGTLAIVAAVLALRFILFPFLARALP
jgi:hypothetical protein